MSSRKPGIYGKDFKVDIPHFYLLEYCEGNHVMNVQIDFRDPVPCLYTNEIKSWNPPYENEVITAEKKEEIVSNIYHYLTNIKGFKKINVAR